MQKITTIFAFFFVLLSPALAQENAGGSAILELAGIEKPAAWSQWNQMQKHNWFQNHGIYPASGNKYEGRFDIERYFEFLGTEMPSDWDTKSFAERKAFVDDTQKNNNPAASSLSAESSDLTPNGTLASDAEQSSAVSERLLVMGIIITVFLIGTILIIFSHKKGKKLT